MPEHQPTQPLPETLQGGIENVAQQAQQEVSRSRVPWYQASRRALFFIALYLIEFVLFTSLAVFVHFHPVDWVDTAITREFQENHASWLVNLMTWVSYLGYHYLIFTALIAVTALLLWLVHLRLEALYVVTLSAVSELLNVAIKLIVNRPRPSAHLVEVFRHASGQSFPSGHVMSYVAYWGLLFSLGVILFKHDRWWHYLLLIVPALFVVLVGPSRIYLGAHWASDVLGAYLISSLLLGVSLWLYLNLKRRGVLAYKAKPGEPVIEPQPTK
jgi:membrane-associated phospholipid phosphatase